MDAKELLMLRHKLTGHTGVFVEKKNGYYGVVTIIKLQNGREYFAPSHEFEKI